MINRRSVPASHRACLHPKEGGNGAAKSEWEFATKALENGHDSRAMTMKKAQSVPTCLRFTVVNRVDLRQTGVPEFPWCSLRRSQAFDDIITARL